MTGRLNGDWSVVGGSPNCCASSLGWVNEEGRNAGRISLKQQSRAMARWEGQRCVDREFFTAQTLAFALYLGGVSVALFVLETDTTTPD